MIKRHIFLLYYEFNILPKGNSACQSCLYSNEEIHFTVKAAAEICMHPCCDEKVTFSIIFKLKGCKMKSLLWPLLLCSVAISSREFNSQLERLYQKFVSFNLSNMSSMTCLTSLIRAEIRHFTVSPAFGKLFK